MTKEEEIVEIKKKIEELEDKVKEYHNLEQGIKLTLNSIYGAFGNQYFYFYNVDIAGTITKQGKNAILYTERLINKYFLEGWHKDKKVHEAMGIKVLKPCSKGVSVYIDTDSCDKDTIIHCNDKDRTIEELYNHCDKLGSAGVTLSGHESNNCDVKVLNYSDELGLYYADVKRVIRHKVTKKKWKLKTKSGKEVIVTNDHSLIVFRDGKEISVKPFEIKKGDKILSVQYVNMNYIFEDVESIECIGEFDNEYVYDIEIDDDTHTFIANDILVHNSVYVEFDEVMNNCEGWKGTPKEFIMKLYEVRLDGYIQRILQNYADHFHADNTLKFELETISRSGIWLSKKKYVKDIVWHDPNIDYESGTFIDSKGVEIIQSSTPVFAREYLNDLARYLLLQDKIDIREFTKQLKQIKKKFQLANIDEISFSKTMNNYNQYIVDDYKTFELGKKCPIGVKAAGYYNYLLNNSKYKNKYSLLSSGSKVKIYYTKDKNCEVFAYSNGEYPNEFAPEIDYDTQFEKAILDPINRFIKVMGFKEYDRHLMYTSSVF